MAALPDIVPISDLRQDAAAVLKQVRKSRHPVVITQRGRAAAVMMSIEEYEHAEQQRQLLRLLALGEREIEAGNGHDIIDVLKEADAFLRDATH